MSTALYRRYRSARFGDLIGQDQIGATLRNQVSNDQLAHAYLFAGIRGTGKTSTARILARAINCLDAKDGEPCNECTACVEILSGAAVDVLEIDAASNRGIDEIRELRERVNYLPASLKRKVYIIDEAHMLTTPAWNAFLKTLEEPPAHVVFLLATTEPHGVPETIRSRVQRFDFRRVSTSDIVGHLTKIAAAEGVAVEVGALDILALAAQGSVRDALSLLDQAIASGERPLDAAATRRALGLADPQAVRDMLGAIAERDPGRALRAVHAAFDAGADARQIVREVARLARGAALGAVGYLEGAALGTEEAELCEQLASAGAERWVTALELLSTTERDLRQPIDARLQVEHCLLRLTRPAAVSASDPGALEALLQRVADLERRVAAGATATPTTAPAPAATPATMPAVAPMSMPVPAEPVLAPTAEHGLAPLAAAQDHVAIATPVAATAEHPAPTLVTETAVHDAPKSSGTNGDTKVYDVAATAPHTAPAPAAVTAVHTAPLPAVAPGAGPVDVDGWTAMWAHLVEAVNRRDPMLAGALRDCRPFEAQPGKLVVGAPYRFHLDRISEPARRAALLEAVAEVGGGAYEVDAVFCGDDAPAATRRDGGRSAVTEAALETFKGSRITASRMRDDSLDNSDGRG